MDGLRTGSPDRSATQGLGQLACALTAAAIRTPSRRPARAGRRELIPLAARARRDRRDEHEEAAARLRGDRRPDLAQRDHRPRASSTRAATARSPGSDELRCPILIQVAERRLDRRRPTPAQGGRLAGQGPLRGARVPLRPLRHLPRPMARALDRRPAPLPAAPPGRRSLERAAPSALAAAEDRDQGRRRRRTSRRTSSSARTRSPSSSTSGPSGAARAARWAPRSRSAVRDRDGRRRARQGRRRLEPASSPSSSASRAFPAVKAFRDGEVVAEFVGAQPPAAIEQFLDYLVPSEAEQLVAAGDEDVPAQGAGARPAQRPPPRRRWPSTSLARGDTAEALEVLEPIGALDFVADGLRARIELDGAEGPTTLVSDAFGAWDADDPAAALERPPGRRCRTPTRRASRPHPPRDRRDLHRARPAHPLAAEHRRRLAAALN